MYEIVKAFNDETKLAVKNNHLFIVKKINYHDKPVYDRLMMTDNFNIAKIYEIVLIDDSFYAVTEFVQGVTLREYVEQYGELDDLTVKRIALDICNGLEAIHNLGIVHRDINPNNIMIDRLGNAVIIDFGISRLETLHKSKDTQILGTQGYSAPEQFGFKQTNCRADIYSLGVLINYMKTKSLPDEKRADGFFSSIVNKCTQIDENNRYKDVESLASSIRKKINFAHIVRMLPGFRKKVWWHSVIACVYYFLLILFLAVSFAFDGSYKEKLCVFFLFLFMFGVPVPILTNFNQWTQKLSFIKNQNRQNKIFMQVLLSVLSVMIGFVFILIYPA